MARVDFTVENHIANITLTRGDKMNALDEDMMDAIIDAGERLKRESGVRAAVLHGEGRAFCAGLDMANFGRMVDNAEKEPREGDNDAVPRRLAPRTHGLANRPQKVAWTWREAPVPVIAAGHGVVLGGGFQLFLGADIRYAAPATRFSILEIKWGLVPDMGATHIMTRIAREDVVKELALTGRMFETEEALHHGFVTQIHDDPLAAAMETAHAIANRNPDATRGIKRVFNEHADRQAAESLLLESVIQDDVIGAPNQIEAVMSELEKRPANFAG